MAQYIQGNVLARPLYTLPTDLSSVDSRNKIYINTGETVDLNTFKGLRSPYPHLRVHVHIKPDRVGTQELGVGIYEIDTVDFEYDELGEIINTKVTSFHQVYSTAYGKESDYNDKSNNIDSTLSYNEKYKNIVFYTETGKVYLNGILYGSEGTSSGTYKSNIEDGSIAMTEDYGDFKVGTTVASLTGKKTYDELFDGILFPTVNPTFIDPSASISLKSGFNATQEVGSAGPKTVGAMGADVIVGFSRGKIMLNGKEVGPYSGEQDPGNSFVYVDDNTDDKILPSVFKNGTYKLTYKAAYTEGDQPKNNKGGNAGKPCAAGSKTASLTLTGTYYAFVGFTDSDPRDPSFNFRSFIGNGYTRLGKGNVNAGTCNKAWMFVCIPSDWNFTCNTAAGTSMRNNFTEEGEATIILPDNTKKDYKYYALTYANGDFKDLVIK